MGYRRLVRHKIRFECEVCGKIILIRKTTLLIKTWLIGLIRGKQNWFRLIYHPLKNTDQKGGIEMYYVCSKECLGALIRNKEVGEIFTMPIT